ncbi:MAG: Gfo/Idh/MocA family oxidoreductase [Proteobacteria bacterium]|nr:Gfo/Idh/MocA family oxidoreductase [Pseudomonadota bacterium]
MFNISILGLGWWGSKLLRNFHNHTQIAQVIGVDHSQACREEIFKTFSVKCFAGYDKVIADKNITAVVVATPPPTHFELAKQSLLSGKDVLLTKPPTQTIGELEELTEIAQAGNRIFMMDSTFVYSDPVRKVKTLLDGGLFDNIRFVQSLRYGNDLRMHHISRLKNTMLKNDVNVVDDLFFHDMAILNYLFPDEEFKPISVHHANMLSDDLCDTAFIRLDTKRFPVHVGLSWTLPERRRELLIADGEKQLIYDDLKQENKLELFWIEEKKQEFIDHGNGEPLFMVADHFVKCVEKRQQPFTDGQYMLKVMKSLNAVQDLSRGVR